MMTTRNSELVRHAELVSLLGAVALLAAYLLLREWNLTSALLRAGRGLLPASALAVFAFIQLRAVRRFYKMQARIHFEALALGYPVAFAAIMLIRFLQAEGFLASWTLAEIWPLIPFPYFVGYALAWWRYR